MQKVELPPIIYKGSVKNIRHEPEASHILFEFSDRYSIYDWGEMPDLIKNKGKHLCSFTNIIYTKLEDKSFWRDWESTQKVNDAILNELKADGLRNHRSKSEEPKKNIWKVERIFVPNILDQDYSFFKKLPITTLVPLEVIFRFGIPKGSSLLVRAKEQPNYLKSIGINQAIEEGEVLKSSLVEFSTKLEPLDRYLSLNEARAISGCNETEFQRLIDLTKIISLRLRDFFQTLGLSLWDGKLEFAFLEGVQGRGFMLVDTIAPDEIRLMYRDMPLSKEVLRQAYWQEDWYKNIADYKKRFDSAWKEEMHKAGLLPTKLKQEQLTWVEDMYGYLVKALMEPTESRHLWEDLYERYKRLF